MAEAATTASNASTAAASDPYVIYQLRKPSQRGTAVIPRFVPNTHAPAFSPANYRFARVWANDSNAPPNSLLQVPRSFEYAGSLGSESSFWSDTSSWVSVSSLRTAQSDQRQPLLHSASPAKVSAAAFFAKDYGPTTNALRSTSNRSSDINRPTFRYPAALSESISEDAVVDDLLGTRDSRFPHISTSGHSQRLTMRPSNDHHSRAPRNTSRALPRSGLLPALTRKRRNLWQWLFCSDQVATSTVASVTGPPAPPKNRGRAADRVPGGDKEFFGRTSRGRDNQKSKSRTPSFELRRGRPERESPRRTVSWSFVPKALLGRDQRRRKPPSTKPPARENPVKEDFIKRSQRKKDRPRAYVEEPESRGNKFGFAKAMPGRTESPHRREPTRSEEERRRRPQEKSRQDRPREDRPRQSGKPHLKNPSSVAPVQTSVVPSLREKDGSGSFQPLMQRMRSADSSDPVTSRISSDLSSTLERSLGSRSGSSTPVDLKKALGGARGLEPAAHGLDPAANGVSSDVSSHASGVHEKHSPDSQVPISDETEPPVMLGGIDFSTINAARASRNPQLRSGLFAFPSSSTESSGILGQNGARSWEKAQTYSGNSTSEDQHGLDNYVGLTNAAVGATEQSLKSSIGDPLSYLITKERDTDADTQSTGLTSLADESVSTHKTVSGVPDDFRIIPSTNGAPRYQNRDPKISARQMHEHRDDLSDSSGSANQQPHIFKNSALFSRNQPMSPSHLSSASPRRFHSDWSDPHATDIDVFCQCDCSCVYEEECRRSCDLVYGRSPSVSSTRSCSRRSGFQSLPPGVSSSELKNRRPSEDSRSGDGRSGYAGSRNSDHEVSERARMQEEKKYGRPPAGNGHLDSRPYRGHSTSSAYSPDPFSYQPYSAKPQLRNDDEGRTGRHSRTQQFDDRPRGGDGNQHRSRSSSSSVYRKSGKETHSSRPRAREAENGKTVRRHETSSPYKSHHHAEVRTSSREQRSRTSSRTTNSSRNSSGLQRENNRDYPGHRAGSRESPQGTGKQERRSRRTDEKRAGGSTESKYGGAQQMGNSFVVRRNGPPPFNQPSTQAYKTAEEARNWIPQGNDDGKPRDATRRRGRDIHAGLHQVIPPEPYGSRPKVELEPDTRRVSSPLMYRNHTSRSRERTLAQRPGGVSNAAAREDVDVSRRRKPESGYQPNRKSGPSGYGQRGKTEARPSSRQAKSSTRQVSRNGAQGRAPLFGIF
eukprot:GFKZ01011863.1.p1 GENE.GFKZ01011863.1~~GFKZ01011863.1.p1  ORF type:complete len:1220 (-),score=115.51 GFKZ01011863.1:674-4333(-)